jgi:hypothetical protein
MKNHLLILVLGALTFFSCSEENVVPDNAFDESSFLKRSSPQFHGSVIDINIGWYFSNWDNGIGSYQGTFHCVIDNENVHQKRFSIYDFNNRTEVSGIEIFSPAFDIRNNEDERLNIFKVGLNEVHSVNSSEFSSFMVNVSMGSDGCTLSSSYGSQEGASIIILKSQPYKASHLENRQMVKTWMKVNCKLYDCAGNLKGEVNDGYIIADFELE